MAVGRRERGKECTHTCKTVINTGLAAAVCLDFFPQILQGQKRRELSRSSKKSRKPPPLCLLNLFFPVSSLKH